MFQMFIFMNINGTCWTPHGWACRGRWGCPRALRSPWDPSRSFSFQKSFMKHVSNVHFYEYKWYLLYSPWLSLSRSLRVSLSPQITLGLIQIISFQNLFMRPFCSFSIIPQQKNFCSLFVQKCSYLMFLISVLDLDPQGSLSFGHIPDPEPGSTSWFKKT